MDDPFEYVTPPLKIVRDMVCIPRARHEALMAAAKALPLAWKLPWPWMSDGHRGLITWEEWDARCTAIDKALVALRAASILEGK